MSSTRPGVLRNLIVIVPLLLIGAFATGLPGRLAGLHQPRDTARCADELTASFNQLLQQVASVSDAALVTFPPEAVVLGSLGERLEGLALLDGQLDFVAWDGTPANPPAGFGDPEQSRFQVRLDGATTRLLVRSGPDESGWLTLASFVLDSTAERNSFRSLLPDGIDRGLHLEFRFFDTELGDPDAALAELQLETESDPALDAVALLDDKNHTLGAVRIEALTPEVAIKRFRRTGRAVGIALLVFAIALRLDWRRLVQRPGGLVLALAVIAAARVALRVVRAPSLLLPPEVGTARLYGSLEFQGWLASPADLLLTCVALYLAAAAWRRFLLARPSRGWVSGIGLIAGALGTSCAIAGLALSLGRNTGGESLAQASAFGSAGHLALATGVLFATLAAAELWTSVARLSSKDVRPPVLGVLGLTLVGLIGTMLGLQSLDQRLSLERLNSEIAPQILNQTELRETTLEATLREIRDAYDNGAGTARSTPPDVFYLAYTFWERSALFHAGYRSSLDFYGPTGDHLSHFGFDLPLDPDPVGPAAPEADEPILAVEQFDPVASVQQQLLHGEITIEHDGSPIGTVVAHVLDEPGNLPFLPVSQPYLAALGRRPSRITAVATGWLADGPHYVLYNAQGSVLLSSLPIAPTQSEALRLAAVRGEPIRVRAGEDGYIGVALGEEDRLHLLLIERPGAVQRLAGAVRFGMFGLLGLGLLTIGRYLLRIRGPASLVRAVRGSFYRKLAAALLLASVVPLLGLGLFLRGYISARAENVLAQSSVSFVSSAQRILEDYAAAGFEEGDPTINDSILYWLGRVVGQDIHVYEDGLLLASSRPELFDSGLISTRLHGQVHRELVLGGRPTLVMDTYLGETQFPVAYAPVRNVSASRELIVAVPLVQRPPEIARGVDRVVDMIVLATVLLVGLLAVVAAVLARTVARPVRELVEATAQIGAGDYATRLQPRTEDEVAQLVRGFNRMAGALSDQRADLERRRDYIETLLTHATTGVISLDPTGRIVTANPAASALLPAVADRLVSGAVLIDALRPELEPLAALCEAPLREAGGEPREIDIEGEEKPRRYRVVRVSLPGATGPVGTLILLDDVTELMRNNQLAAWAEMARAIAHEIKNPLTPIQLSTEHVQRILRDRGVLPSADIDRCLDTVMAQVKTLYEIAGEFSAYAKLPDLQPEPLDPVTFMKETVRPYRSADERGVTIAETYEPVGACAIDRRALSRAVVNLLENAMQAMPDGGRIDVRVWRREDLAVLGVRDSGIGLDPEARRRLFEPYFSTKSSGTGLGLAIVRRAVEAHQGTIEVDSVQGEGTEFRILLPLLSGQGAVHTRD